MFPPEERLYLPCISRCALSRSSTIYNEVSRKNTPPRTSTKLVTYSAYCSERNSSVWSLDGVTSRSLSVVRDWRGRDEKFSDNEGEEAESKGSDVLARRVAPPSFTLWWNISESCEQQRNGLKCRMFWSHQWWLYYPTPGFFYHFYPPF